LNKSVINIIKKSKDEIQNLNTY